MNIANIQQVVSQSLSLGRREQKKEIVPGKDVQTQYVHHQAYDRSGKMKSSLLPPTVNVRR